MTYTATFSNGTKIKRNSHRSYAFAWAVFENGKISYKGFSADRANAAKAASAQMPSGVSQRDRKNYGLRLYWSKLAKERGFDSVDAMIQHWDDVAAERRSSMSIEIVPVA